MNILTHSPLNHYERNNLDGAMRVLSGIFQKSNDCFFSSDCLSSLSVTSLQNAAILARFITCLIPEKSKVNLFLPMMRKKRTNLKRCWTRQDNCKNFRDRSSIPAVLYR